jgi:hypothetical protein
MTSLPAFIKVGKTPATQNLGLEQYAVKIGNSMLFLYDNYINLQCGKPFFSNTRQNGEWTETITRQDEKELAMFGE